MKRPFWASNRIMARKPKRSNRNWFIGCDATRTFEGQGCWYCGYVNKYPRTYKWRKPYQEGEDFTNG